MKLMREIEIKVINIDINELRTKLVQLGAKKIFTGDVSSIILDYKDKRLSKKDSFLRLRSFDNKKFELTFKGPQQKGPYKVRKEINIGISELADTQKILQSLGLTVIKKIYKFRESYELIIKVGKRSIHYHVDIDDYKIIPEFLELEAKNEKDLAYIIKLLKIPKKNLYNGSTTGILKMYGIKQNL